MVTVANKRAVRCIGPDMSTTRVFRLIALLVGALLLVGPAFGAVSTPAQALAPAGVSGRVLAPDGSPKAGALVRLMDMLAGSVDVTTTATDGTFTFDGSQRPEQFIVQVCQDLAVDPCVFPSQNREFVKVYVGPEQRSFALVALTSYFQTTDASPAVDTGDIRLTKPATVVVSVTNGVPLKYRRHLDLSGLVRPYNNRRITFHGVAPGRHLLRAFGQRILFTVGAGQTRTVRVSRRQPAVVGRVVVDGRPVRGVPVTLLGADDDNPGVEQMTRTGRDGRYAFRWLAMSKDPWRLRIGSALDASGPHTLVPGYPRRLARFTLSAGQTKTVDLVTRSRTRGSLVVRLRQQPAGPATRRTALIGGDGALVGNLAFRRGRSFTDGLAPGRYVVATHWFSSDGDESTGRTTVQVRARQVTDTTLSPRTGPGRATVLAPAGSQVFATALFPGEAGSVLREYAAAEHRLVVPASGQVVFRDLPTGSYRFYLSPADDRPDETVTRNVGAAGTTVDLSTPSPEASIRGRLVNPATGEAWPWTRVVARTLDCNGDHDSGQAQLDDGGELIVDRLHTGRYACELAGLRQDAGTPYRLDNGGFLSVGSFTVTAGQQLVRDFPAPYPRR